MNWIKNFFLLRKKENFYLQINSVVSSTDTNVVDSRNVSYMVYMSCWIKIYIGKLNLSVGSDNYFVNLFHLLITSWMVAVLLHVMKYV